MKINVKAIVAIILMITAIGVVGRQFFGFSFSSSRTPASTAIAAPTPTANPASAAARPASAAMKPAVQPEQKTVSLQTQYEELLAKVSEKDLAYRNPGFKNPMRPLISEEAQGSAQAASDDSLDKGYSVKGIIWNDKQPLALVNDQVVGVGERLDDGALITDITPSSVKFTKRGNRYVLVIREEQ